MGALGLNSVLFNDAFPHMPVQPLPELRAKRLKVRILDGLSTLRGDIQGIQQKLGQVDIGTGHPAGRRTAGGDLHAGAVDILAGLAIGQPIAQQSLDDHVVIKQRGVGMALAQNLAAQAQQRSRGIFVDTKANARIDHGGMGDAAQKQLGQLIADIPAIGIASAHHKAHRQPPVNVFIIQYAQAVDQLLGLFTI